MVFTSIVALGRNRGPDEFWRKRKIFKMAAVSSFFLFELLSFFYTKNLMEFYSITLEGLVIVIQLQSEQYIEL